MAPGFRDRYQELQTEVDGDFRNVLVKLSHRLPVKPVAMEEYLEKANGAATRRAATDIHPGGKKILVLEPEGG